MPRKKQFWSEYMKAVLQLMDAMDRAAGNAYFSLTLDNLCLSTLETQVLMRKALTKCQMLQFSAPLGTTTDDLED